MSVIGHTDGSAERSMRRKGSTPSRTRRADAESSAGPASETGRTRSAVPAKRRSEGKRRHPASGADRVTRPAAKPAAAAAAFVESQDILDTIEGIEDQDGMHTMDGVPAGMTAKHTLDPSQLYRGRARLALLRDLAMNEWTDETIANSVGVHVSIITDFRLTYENEISEVRASLAGQLAVETAGLWISKKQNRVAELQQDFEDIDVVIDQMRKNTERYANTETDGSDTLRDGDAFDANLLLGSRRHQNLLRAKIAVLRAVADEYAPKKGEKDQPTDEKGVRYIIEQDDGKDDVIGSLT